MIIMGNSIYQRCNECGQLVKLNKFIVGSLHLCVTDEEKKQRMAFKSSQPVNTKFLGGSLDCDLYEYARKCRQDSS